MAASFYFYDLETTSISPRTGRVMQFAGQRTDMQLNPIGEPANVLIKLAADVLPDPEAILVTGITPQQTLLDGYTEAEFLAYFYDEIVQPDTIFVGYNSVRFDDEFMRFLHYRNFYDPYEWQWASGCSRWDILDVVRMTRALRPDGIEWPFTDDGKPTNRLELLTKLNNLDHSHAHDALSDVLATIAVAKLIQSNQPELFQYLVSVRSKKQVAALVQNGEPFVYVSGKYPGEFLCTSAVVMLSSDASRGEALVYNLRHDPLPFLEMSVEELITAWTVASSDTKEQKLPVKTIKYNRCPAVAPLGVIKDDASQQRIGLELQTITQHLNELKKHQASFVKNLLLAKTQMDSARDNTRSGEVQTVDQRLYESFISNDDKQTMRAVRTSKPIDITDDAFKFNDERLEQLLPLYKARNYPQSLSVAERTSWEEHRAESLFDGGESSSLAQYFEKLKQLSSGITDYKTKTIIPLTDDQKYLLEELQLYGQSIVPADASE